MGHANNTARRQEERRAEEDRAVTHWLENFQAAKKSRDDKALRRARKKLIGFGFHFNDDDNPFMPAH